MLYSSISSSVFLIVFLTFITFLWITMWCFYAVSCQGEYTCLFKDLTFLCEKNIQNLSFLFCFDFKKIHYHFLLYSNLTEYHNLLIPSYNSISINQPVPTSKSSLHSPASDNHDTLNLWEMNFFTYHKDLEFHPCHFKWQDVILFIDE